MKRVLIGGIGNVLLGDDGVGPYVIRLLAARYEFEEGVEIVDLGTPALDLIDHFAANEAVILIDSVDTKAEPGAVLLYRKADIMRLNPGVRMDPHSPALVDALMSAEMFGVAASDVLLVGIEAETFEVGCTLSQAVAASMELAIGEVLHELDRLSIKYRLRQQPAELGIWWTSATANEDIVDSQRLPA